MISQTVPLWYAFVTRSRHEKRVKRHLDDRGVESYLPLQKALRQWKDRKKFVETPLFSCYIFAHVAYVNRYDVLTAPSVVRMVSLGRQPTPVREEEIDAIRRILDSDQYYEVNGQLHEGERVEVLGGPLRGIKGDLVSFRGGERVVVNVGAIGQSLVIDVDRRLVRRVQDGAAEISAVSVERGRKSAGAVSDRLMPAKVADNGQPEGFR
jgi:transcription antitermination factor NusG